jgi:hypothetical protein
MILVICLACSDDNVTTDGDGTQAAGVLIIPNGWEGEWEIEFTYKDCISANVTSTEQIIDSLCPGDTITIEISALLDNCNSAVIGDSLDLSCNYDFVDGACSVSVSFELGVRRNEGSMSGSGQWSAAISGTCSDFYEDVCETIELVGTRLSSVPFDCGR